MDSKPTNEKYSRILNKAKASIILIETIFTNSRKVLRTMKSK